jgi:branched-chain amino acid transport system substrate-binding protein
MMKIRSVAVVGVLASVGLLASGCTQSSTSKTTGSGGAPTGSGPSVSSTQGTGANEAAVNQWALTYTGGSAGAAHGTPITIGYANQEDVFPEATIGIDAAVKYVNAELGGIGGHPIRLTSCKITVEEDGQKCGTQFVNDSSVSVVMTGTLLVGAKGLYDTLAGKKPVVIGNGLTTDDFTTTAGYSLFTGAVGVVGGLARYVATQVQPKPKKVAVMYGDNASAQGAYALLLKPVLDKAGIQVTGIQVKDPGGTAAEVQSAIQNSGADTADVFITLTTQPECIATYDSLKQLGITPMVITTGLCFGTPMTDHIRDAGETGTMPDGWYFGEYGYNYYAPDLASGILTYVTKVQQYGVKAPGAKSLEYTGFAGPLFSNLLTVAKLANKIGADRLTPDAILAAIKAFTGPMMLQVGPLDCGKVKVGGVLFPAVCASQMGIIRYKGGKWISIADGLNGKPIDASKS